MALVHTINEITTHLPDAVVFADHDKKLPYQQTLQGVLMFLDISGFTSLCEKYSLNSKNGTDQLTKTLNGYMEALVNEVLMHDGDILKFAGDAILTLWPVDSFLKMKVTVAHVLRCALNIQSKCGEWITSVGVKLRVKIGISSGEVAVTYLGNNEFCHYVTMGRTVQAVNQAEKFCVSGDVVLSPSAWVHCGGLPLEYELLDDQKHYKITEMLDCAVAKNYQMIRTVQMTDAIAEVMEKDMNKNVKKPVKRGSIVSKISTPMSGIASDIKPSGLRLPSTPQTNKIKKTPKANADKEDKTRVRKAVIEPLNDYIVNGILRLYVAQPVLRKMDEHQPLAYLSEMRQVTIVFINLVVQESTKYEFCQTLQNAFNIIYNCAKQTQGCLNKIFMFDKGCTFLVIFGLPGYKHEKDCAHALQCADRMKKQLDQDVLIERTSIGVTTGSSFTGVVGHNHRHEYTVIGRKVNMAARLMMYYPGKVTCDNETFHHSKLHKGNFVTMEMKELKGLQNIGIIREFKENKSRIGNLKMLLQQEYENPLIGREVGMTKFTSELSKIKKNPDAGSQRQLIVIEGEAGIGKSRMMDAITVKSLHQNIKVVPCTLTMHDTKSPYYVVKCLLMELFEFDYDMPHQEREHVLFQTFTDPFILENLSLLNDLMCLQLPQSEKYLHMNETQRIAMFHDLLDHIVKEVTSQQGFIIFTVDDSHFMDAESWEFVADLGNDMRSLVVMTVKTESSTHLSETALRALGSDTTLHMKLSGLEAEHLAPLACQLLGVQLIPKKLDEFLKQKSHGVPAWCDQILRELFYQGILTIVPQSKKDTGTTMVAPPPRYASRIRKSSLQVETELLGAKKPRDPVVEGFSLDAEVEEIAPLVCQLVTGQSLEVGIPDSIKGMIQARIDRMKEIDQLVIKTASILGITFAIPMLLAILPDKVEELKALRALRSLRKSGIFVYVAASSQEESHRPGTATPGPGDEEDGLEGLGFKRRQHLIKFKSTSIQETSYNMMIEGTRRMLHASAAKYLESQENKCQACGGGGIFPEHMLGSAMTLDDNTETEKEKSLPRKSTDSGCGTTSARQRRMTELAYQGSSKQALGYEGRRQSVTLGLLEHGRRRALNADDSIGQGGGRRNTMRVDQIFDTTHEEPSGSTPQGSGAAGHTDTMTMMESAMKRQGLSGKSQGGAVVKALRDKFTKHNSVEPGEEDDNSLNEEEDEGEEAEIDMRECKCLKILNSVYPQLVLHWRAAGNLGRTTHFLMEAAAAAIAIYDNLKALSYLREVSSLLDAFKDGKNPLDSEATEEYEIDKWEEARMESLIGQALFHMGQCDEAIPHFRKSVASLGTYHPTGKLTILCKILSEGTRQWKHNKFPDSYIGKANPLLAHRLTEQARCLSHIFHEYVSKQNNLGALFTVLQQLNMAESANKDLHELLTAYSCMMECCQLFGWKSLSMTYETKANIKCLVAMRCITPEDLVCVCHLYYTIMNFRLNWGRIIDAIDSGFMANRIAKKLHENDLKIDMLPMLAQALLLNNRVVDMVDVLKELQCICTGTDCVIAKAWYYACCVDIILETGFELEPIGVCIDFANVAKQDQIFQSDHLPLFYLACCMTVWFQRTQDVRQAEMWEDIATDNCPYVLDTYMTIRGFVKLMEFKLLCLAQKKRDKAVQEIPVLKKDVYQDLLTLKKMCLKMTVFDQRYLHLLAYYKALDGKMSAAKSLLKKCVKSSLSVGNVLEHYWAAHSQSQWLDANADKQQAVAWINSARGSMLDWHQASEMDGSVNKYTLPVPKS